MNVHTNVNLPPPPCQREQQNRDLFVTQHPRLPAQRSCQNSPHTGYSDHVPLDNQPRKRATIHDVAREAGISRGTVSRYFNGDAYVSTASREAIERAIAKVGYVPNTAARNLVRQRTQTVAFIVHEPAALFTEDPNIGGILVGANNELSTRDYQLVCLVIDSERDTHRVEQYLKGGFVDGAIVVSARHGDPVTQVITDSTMPATYIGHPTDLKNVPFIGIDNITAARTITRVLLDAGHTHIGMLAAGTDRDSGVDRLHGFTQEMGDHFNRALIQHLETYSYNDGYNGALELLRRAPDVTALFAASDAVAAGAVNAVKRLGLRIPEDLSIVGFDDSVWATRSDPQLTTIHQPSRGMGAVAAQCTIAQIEGTYPHWASSHHLITDGDAPGIMLDTHLVHRDSVTSPRPH